MPLDSSQHAAVDQMATLRHRTNLLIGRGGAGKTFTIQHLLTQLWEDETNDIEPETTFLTAPTGKAAKVINDAFANDGFEVFNPAKTIHRLLEFHPAFGWGYDENNHLNATLVIIDEASMVDSLLLYLVIRALPKDCLLILVGDDAQLPPVAPGQPFTDLINLGPKEIINRLTRNHRQAQGSLIANGCLSILEGQVPTWGTKGEFTLKGTLEDDLFFIQEQDKEAIPAIVADICRPWHEQNLDYAVLAPQRKGVVGVEEINKYLQEQLNPADQGKPQLKIGWLTFRLGDRVLQTKNNYDLDVFNGFTGVVAGVDERERRMVVDFDGQIVTYTKPDDIKQLVLGYCMTVHKSQGSEFKFGILICHSSHYFMWNRSLLYTGVSRFRQELHVIGNKKALRRGLDNVVSGERQTFLKLELGKEAA